MDMLREAVISPRHSRRSSMPASLDSLAEKESWTRASSAAAVKKEKLHKREPDALSISNNWDRFEVELSTKKLRTYLNKHQELPAWRKEFGLIGGSFWGYSCTEAEQAFFRSRLKQKIRAAKVFVTFLMIQYLGEIAFYEKGFMRESSLVALHLSGVFLYLLSNRKITFEWQAVMFITIVGMLDALHNPAFKLLNERNPEVILGAFDLADRGGAAASRRVFFNVTFILAVGSQLFLGIKPAFTAAIMMFLTFFSHIPTIYLYVPLLRNRSDVENLLIVIGPMLLLHMSGMLLGVLFHHYERVDFEKSVLKFDLEERVEMVKKAYMSTSLSNLSDSIRVSRTNSNSSIPGSVDSLGNLVQESVMDKRIRAFQEIQKEYSVRRHPTMQTLVDICIGAMALHARQPSGSNANWSDFFVEKADQEQSLPTGDTVPVDEDQLPKLMPSKSPFVPSRRLENADARSWEAWPRRRSIATVPMTPSPLTINAPTYEPCAKELSKFVPQRQSSTDKLNKIGFTSPLTDYASSTNGMHEQSESGWPNQPVLDLRLNELQVRMKDWNFGSPAGIWGALFETMPESVGLGSPVFQDPLSTISMQAIHHVGALDSPDLNINEGTLRTFLQALERAYLPQNQVPYHNAFHACDVVHTVFATLQMDNLHLPKVGLLSLILAAAGHDVAHPGVNNTHLVATNNPLAITYNDRSVLENFHVSKFFTIMRSDASLDFLAPVRSSNPMLASNFRSLVIEMILATDLKYHLDQQAKVCLFLTDRVRDREQSRNGKSSGSDREDTQEPHSSSEGSSSRGGSPLSFHSAFSVQEPADVSLVCSTLLHAADISNVAKSWETYKLWMDLLFEEFFAQGDIEKTLGMEVQQMMCRDTCDPAAAQVSFITNIVMPLYKVLQPMIPCTCERAMVEMDNNVSMLRTLVKPTSSAASSANKSSSEPSDVSQHLSIKKDQ